VLGILPGLVGVIQATEVIRLILGKGDSLVGRLLLVDALNMRFRELKLRKKSRMPVCGTNPTVTHSLTTSISAGSCRELHRRRI